MTCTHWLLFQGRRTLLLIGAITMTCSVITLSAVTRQVGYSPSENPCDRNFISAGHTYISEPAYRLREHCHERAHSNHTKSPAMSNHTSAVIYSVINNSSMQNSLRIVNGLPSGLNFSYGFADHRNSSSDNGTYFNNCTKFHQHIEVHQIHRYPPSVKFVCLLALMVFVAGYAIGYGPGTLHCSLLLVRGVAPLKLQNRGWMDPEKNGFETDGVSDHIEP